CVNYAVHADAAEAVVAEIATAGGRAIAVAADVAEPAAVEAMVTRTEAELGPVTILVNNAGVAWQGTLDTYDRKQVGRMRGITVNGVAPGFVRTDMTQRGRGAADWPGTEERLAARAMMNRIGEPEDIANAVVFLASPKSGWITAQVLTVDGGRMDYIGHG